MDGLQTNFLAAAERVKTLSYNPSDDVKLNLYSLYKQAFFGNNSTGMLIVLVDYLLAKPGMFSFKEKAKWEAWNSLKDKVSKEKAMEDYIALVNKLFHNAN